MSENRLPKSIDAKRITEQSTQFSGTLALDGMTRFLSHVVSAKQMAQVVINGGIDTDGRAFLKGKVDVGVELQCQRCMQPFDKQLNSTFCLVPIAHDYEAKQLPDHYEAWLLEDQIIDVATLIEDELLLALPIVPRHAVNECSVRLSNQDQIAGADKRPNPFSVLAELKQKK